MDAAEWDARYAGTDLVWTAEPNRFVVEETKDLAAGRALDLACGEGRNAVWLAGRGWEVTGVDFSRAAIAKAKALGQHFDVYVEWVCLDVFEWETPEDEDYDLVLLSYLHVAPSDRTYLLRKAMLSLRSGGKLVIVGHDRSNLTEGVGGPRDPAILLDPDELATELAVMAAEFSELGELRIDRAERVRRPVVVDGQQRSAIDTLVTAVWLVNGPFFGLAPFGGPSGAGS